MKKEKTLTEYKKQVISEILELQMEYRNFSLEIHEDKIVIRTPLYYTTIKPCADDSFYKNILESLKVYTQQSKEGK